MQAITNVSLVVSSNIQAVTAYTIWLVAEDTAGNTQLALVSLSPTTVDLTPPTFEQLSIEYISPSTFYIEVPFVSSP